MTHDPSTLQADETGMAAQSRPVPRELVLIALSMGLAVLIALMQLARSLDML